ncbi:MAG TPA: NRDE family protein [Polyangiaceae bacterium]|nr:NRDE family protein [Polyangiaceae bacterium]
MCTLIVLHRPEHEWPVLIGANRDEMLNRPWRAPGRHWPERPNVIAGLDELGAGSWFGVNAEGVAAGVMNRQATLGPAPGKRSRGELVLDALAHDHAEAAAVALSALDPDAYRAFNLVIADCNGVYWLRHTAAPGTPVELLPLPPGLSMLTAYDVNDASSARIRRYLPRLQQARPPDPERGDWSDWTELLASRESDVTGLREGAMNVVTEFGFGTVSSQLVAIPAGRRKGAKIQFRFAAGRPDLVPFEDV